MNAVQKSMHWPERGSAAVAKSLRLGFDAHDRFRVWERNLFDLKNGNS
jgi:hypothetical protein